MAPLQHLSDLGRTHNGPEGLDRLIVGKIFRWGQICTQDALSVPQSPFYQAIVLHGSKTSPISMSLCDYFTDYHVSGEGQTLDAPRPHHKDTQFAKIS